MTPTIVAKNVQKSYGSFEALKSIHLEIPQQQIFGIVGTSGAGKTTLLKILSTLEKPDRGELELLGQKVPYDNPLELSELRKNFGVIFQNYHLLSGLSVYDNIALPLKILNLSSSQIDKAVNELLYLTGLESKKELYPAHLSGGQKQRVAIARALVSKPKLLLCDEPTAALDPDNTHSILELLNEIRHTLKTTIVIVTHEIGLVGSICDQIAVVHEGKVEESGFVHEVFFNPQKTSTQKLLTPRPPRALDFVSQEELEKVSLYELRFMGSSAKDPIIAELVSKFGIYPNILQGSIDKVGPSTLGTLLISFDKNHPKLQEALHFLESKKITLTQVDSP